MEQERYTIEWIPVLLVGQAARERGYQDDDAYGRSFGDFVNQDEFTQTKSFSSKTEAFRAAKSRVRIDVCGEIRIAHEFYEPNLDWWEERCVYHVHRGTRNMREAA